MEVSMETQERYLTEKECSDITSFALPTLRNHRFQRRGIPYSKLNRAVRYRLKDILDYMESHRIDFEH